jgi:hypothetical protein
MFRCLLPLQAQAIRYDGFSMEVETFESIDELLEMRNNWFSGKGLRPFRRMGISFYRK